MPYRWNDAPNAPVLVLWPHRSLPRRGFAAMILFAFTMGTIPLYGLLGTVFFWTILPFILAMVAALWWGLERSYKDGDVVEELHFSGENLHLVHSPSKGENKSWECNVFWARAELHVAGGPVSNYVTLSGNGRTVEIGSFLSEDERKALFNELDDFLRTRR